MKNIIFLRRPKLGLGSLRGMVSYLNDDGVAPLDRAVTHSFGTPASYAFAEPFKEIPLEVRQDSVIVRWGCTAATGMAAERQLNKSDAIHRVSDKLGFRRLLTGEDPDIIPNTIFDTAGFEFEDIYPLVVRPPTHAQGKNLWVAHDHAELVSIVHQKLGGGAFYASTLVEKKQEFRVYVFHGRVATVAEKTPDDPTKVAWNVAQGGKFDVVRWGDWQMPVIEAAIRAWNHSGLDFGGVDVMTDGDGRAYVIEINSAPSLPLLSDGSVSYRQKCMAKCFRYVAEEHPYPDAPSYHHGWKGVIHPAIQMWKEG